MIKNLASLLGLLLAIFPVAASGQTTTSMNGADVVDASTMHHKVMCGYQGWFTCPGDGSGCGWASHWSKDNNHLTPKTIHVEYWPDMSEMGKDERFAVPGFTYPDGSQAELFSSHNARTVLRHFEWMRDYGIDGAWLQRFLVGLHGGPGENFYQERLQLCQTSQKLGRPHLLSVHLFSLAKKNLIALKPIHTTSLRD